MEPATKQDLKDFLKELREELRESIKEAFAEAFGNTKPALEHATTSTASQLVAMDAKVPPPACSSPDQGTSALYLAPTATIDIVPKLDVDVTGVAAPAPTICSTDGLNHNADGDDHMAAWQATWSAPTPLNLPQEASPTPSLCLFVDLAIPTPTTCLIHVRDLDAGDIRVTEVPMFTPAVDWSIKQHGQVLRPMPWPSFACRSESTYGWIPCSGLTPHIQGNCSTVELRPLPWPSFKCSQVSLLWQLEKIRNHTKVASVGIFVQEIVGDNNNIYMPSFHLGYVTGWEVLFCLCMGCDIAYYSSKHLGHQAVGICPFMTRHLGFFPGDELFFGAAKIMLSVWPLECLQSLRPQPPWLSILTNVAIEVEVVGLHLVVGQILQAWYYFDGTECLNTSVNWHFLRKEEFERSGSYSHDSMSIGGKVVQIIRLVTNIYFCHTTMPQSAMKNMGSDLVYINRLFHFHPAAMLGLQGLTSYYLSDWTCAIHWNKSYEEFSPDNHNQDGLAREPLFKLELAAIASIYGLRWCVAPLIASLDEALLGSISQPEVWLVQFKAEKLEYRVGITTVGLQSLCAVYIQIQLGACARDGDKQASLQEGKNVSLLVSNSFSIAYFHRTEKLISLLGAFCESSSELQLVPCFCVWISHELVLMCYCRATLQSAQCDDEDGMATRTQCVVLIQYMDAPWDPGGSTWCRQFSHGDNHEPFQGGRGVIALSAFFEQVPISHKYCFDFYQVRANSDDGSFDLAQVYLYNSYHRDNIITKECRVSWDPGGEGTTSAWGQAEFQGGRSVRESILGPYRAGVCTVNGLGPVASTGGQLQILTEGSDQRIRDGSGRNGGGFLPPTPGSRTLAPSCYFPLAHLCLYPVHVARSKPSYVE